MIKSQFSDFSKKCEILAKVLDDVGKIHPFIQGVLYLTLTLSVVIDLLYCRCGFCVQGGD